MCGVYRWCVSRWSCFKAGDLISETAMERANKMEDYSLRTFHALDPVLEEVLQRSRSHKIPMIHVGCMDGLHLQVMMRMGGYKKVVEVGTLAGFSGICIARGLGADGILHTIDCNPEFAEVAKESFEKAGVADRVKVHVGAALEILEQIKSEGPFDAIFIDADKHNYPNYLTWAEENVRVGGAVIGDNTFAWGHIADTTFESASGASIPNAQFDINSSGNQIRGLQIFNSRLANSPRFIATILPTEQGLTVAVKLQ